MNINALLSSSTSGAQGSSTGASKATTAISTSPLLAKAEQRIQSALDSGNAQLSKFGLLKSALADGQVTALALTQISSTAKPEAVTTALGTFFKTFNAAISAATGTAKSSAPMTSAANSAKRVISEAKSALRSDTAVADAMKKLGLTMQSDGSLVQDAKKFATLLASDPAGVRAALAVVGKKVEALNSRELTTSGTVGAALTGLGQSNAALTAQQKALMAFEQTASA
jgi:hypothetical protein